MTTKSEHISTPPEDTINYEEEFIEHAVTREDLVYDEDEVEPELHFRTYLAVAAMFVQLFVMLLALQGPIVVLSILGKQLGDPDSQNWITNGYSLVQAVLAPGVSAASDAFQARKTILVSCNIIALIGAAIAPGSQSIGRLVAANCLMGVAFACAPLVYAIPSEIVPHKWRPVSQAFINCGAALGSALGPVFMGLLVENDEEEGWRTFYKILCGLYGFIIIGSIFGYRPPKRHALIHEATFWKKIAHLDLPGTFILAAGLTLLLVGIQLGGGKYEWTDARVLSTIIVGGVGLIFFGVYQWVVKTGILHRDLFQGGKEAGRTFALCVFLIMMEGAVLFAFLIFYPILLEVVYEKGPVQVSLGNFVYNGVGVAVTWVWGYASSRLRTIRGPLLAGFFIYTVGTIGFTTLQIKHGERNGFIYAAVSGIGFAGLVVLLIVGVQLSTPHHLIATASAVITSARSIATTTMTAIYSATLSNLLGSKIPKNVSKAALRNGLQASSLGAFIGAIADNDQEALQNIPGVTPDIIAAGVHGLKEAYMDSVRVIFIIAVPLGAVGCIACLFLGTMEKNMTYRVDAPVEELHARQKQGSEEAQDETQS